MNKNFEKYIMSIVDKYVPILLLQRHTFKAVYGVEHNDSYMECKFRYPYLDARIHYSDKSLKDWKKGKDLVPYIVHEMCHALTDPLYAKATSRYVGKEEIEDERENLTDVITNIVLKSKT